MTRPEPQARTADGLAALRRAGTRHVYADTADTGELRETARRVSLASRALEWSGRRDLETRDRFKHGERRPRCPSNFQSSHTPRTR